MALPKQHLGKLYTVPVHFIEFFVSDGTVAIDPDGPDGPLFEVPIAGPLPEDLGFIE